MEIFRDILFILSILIGTGIVLWIFVCGFDGFSKIKVIVGLTMIAAFISLIIGINSIHIPDIKHNIYSVKSEKNIEGRFGIFSGYIEEEHYYLVYIKQGGGYLLKKYPSSKTYIFEDENKQPYVVEKDAMWKDTERFIIHVPDNTIILKYKIE